MSFVRVLLFVSLLPLQAAAFPAYLPETREGVTVANALQRLVEFIQSPNGQVLFGGDFSADDFRRTADRVRFRVETNRDLFDRFDEKRCLLNRAELMTVEISASPECVRWLNSGSIELYAVLLHEILGLMSIEEPVPGVGSQYPISGKLLSVDVELILTGQRFAMHPTCQVYRWDPLAHLSGARQAELTLLLEAKGYSYGHNLREHLRTGVTSPLFLRIRFDGYERVSRRRWHAKTRLSLSQTYEGISQNSIATKVQKASIVGSYFEDSRQLDIEHVSHLGKYLRSFLVSLPECVRIPNEREKP